MIVNHAKLIALTAAGLAFLSLSAQAQFVYTSGHSDLGLGEETELEPHIHAEDGTIVSGVTAESLGIEEFEADEIVIAVSDATFDHFGNVIGGRPAPSVWDLTGVGVGESLWFLPEDSPTAGLLSVPWLGIGAEEIDLNYWDGNTVSLLLKGINGPTDGVFSMWQAGLTTTFFMSTWDGIDASDIFTLNDISLADHDHVAWGFSKAGIYELTFAAQANLAGELFEEEAVFTFAVGDAAIASVPEPSTWALLGAGAFAVVLMVRQRNRRK